jgi:hypothetical protein
MQPPNTTSMRADGRTFANVDGTDDPAALVRYLDDVTRARAASGRFLMSFLGFFVRGRVPNTAEVQK